MFGILALRNVRHVGGRTSDVGSVKGANNTPEVCIFPPSERCNAVGRCDHEGIEGKPELNSEHTDMGRKIRGPSLRNAESFASDR